jgi:micrococcal nuclease
VLDLKLPCILVGDKMFEYNCKVVKVVDGDTVDVDIDLGFGVWLKKQRIRLYGIDTPESRTRDLEEKKCGLLAKDYLVNSLGEDAVLRTRKDGKGKYGRILGEFIVYDASKDAYRPVNEIMIENKLGVRYFGQSKDDIAQEHITNREYLYETGKITRD